MCLGERGAIDVDLLRIHNVFEMSCFLYEVMFGWYRRSRHVSVQDGGREQREARASPVCEISGCRSLGNTRNRLILWEMVEYLSQDGKEILCLHMYKGCCMQKFGHWTVHT